MDIQIEEDEFGTFPGEDGNTPQTVRRFTITNTVTGFSVQVINYGATITALKVPSKINDGELIDVVLGFEDITGYLTNTSPYFRGTIGRTAGRISKGRFTLDGVDYQLSINNGENHLHGGTRGFDKKMWEAGATGSKVNFQYWCKDGEEGYPGDVLAQASFEITLENELIIEYQAISSKPTPVAFTNHTYFNLGGHKQADQRLARHYMSIRANDITTVDENQIITGEILPVEGTRFDLRNSEDLYSLLEQYPEGYDINYCLNKDETFFARAENTESGIVMEVATDVPGCQFFTANSMPTTVPIIGKEGAHYLRHGAFCLEAQFYPDAVNHEHFPNVILRPGFIHNHKTIHKFSVV